MKQKQYAEKDQLQRKRKKENAKDRGRDAKRLQRLSAEQLHYLYDKVLSRTEHSPFCWEVKDEHLQSNGYPRHIQIGWAQLQGDWDYKDMTQYQFFVPSQVMLAANGYFPESSHDEASHLCANPKCVNPNHLVWEDHTKNDARKKCVVHAVCSHCGARQVLCSHVPPCVKQ